MSTPPPVGRTRVLTAREVGGGWSSSLSALDSWLKNARCVFVQRLPWVFVKETELPRFLLDTVSGTEHVLQAEVMALT